MQLPMNKASSIKYVKYTNASSITMSGGGFNAYDLSLDNSSEDITGYTPVGLMNSASGNSQSILLTSVTFDANFIPTQMALKNMTSSSATINAKKANVTVVFMKE